MEKEIMRKNWISWTLLTMLSFLSVLLIYTNGQITPERNSLAPKITEIDFPPQIAPDGQPVRATIIFDAPEADIELVELRVLISEDLLGNDIRDTSDIQDVSWNPLVEGLKEGSITFKIKTEIEQFVVISVALKGNKRGIGPSEEFSWYSLEPESVIQKWRFSTGDSIHSSPSIGADGTIYFGSDDNHLYALNPDGTQKWRFSTGIIFSSPAIGADGTIYFGSGDNSFFALIDNNEGLAETAWPKFHHDVRSTGSQSAPLF